MKSTLQTEMTGALSESLCLLRMDIQRPRYGKPGTILFEFKGQTHSAVEPTDLMPLAGTQEQAKSWCLKQLLQKLTEVTP